LESWYSDPIGEVAPEGLPPTHSVNAATIRSKFLRQFPSGIFDLKLRLSLETWGTGVIGRDSLGAPIGLQGATFLRSLVQVQLDRFYIYLDRTNLGSTNLTYVPGFRIPSYGSNLESGGSSRIRSESPVPSPQSAGSGGMQVTA